MALYARIHVTMPRDDRISRVGHVAELMFVRFILLSKELLSDGYLTDAQLAFAAAGLPGKPRLHAEKLATEGLIERTNDGWKIPFDKWAKWQETKEQVEAKREENRQRIADWRNKQCNSVTNGARTPHKTSNERPLQSSKLKAQLVEKKNKQKKSTPFVIPSVGEVEAYCRERGNRIDAQRFIDHYTANGWRVGKNPMKDWQATVRNWEKNDDERTSAAGRNSRPLSGIHSNDNRYAPENLPGFISGDDPKPNDPV